MAKLNRKCCVCSHEYYYCNSNCQDSLNKPSWMASFCCENCKNIYEAAAGYFAKQKTAQEARNILDKCDLSNKENFTPATQRLIEEIYENSIDINNVELKPITNEKISDDMRITSDTIVADELVVDQIFADKTAGELNVKSTTDVKQNPSLKKKNKKNR